MTTTMTMRTILAQRFADEAEEFSLHTGDPGTTGANEMSGGSYVRAALTWGSASSGVVTASAVTFLIPADTTIAYIGFWDGSGNFLQSGQVSVGFVLAGTYGPTPRYEQVAGD